MYNLSRDTIWPEFALVDPSNMDTRSFIENTLRSVGKESKRLKKSVQEFYDKLLVPVNDQIVQNKVLPETKERLQCCFKDIYLSLKVHVMFYRGIDKKPFEENDKKIDETLKKIRHLLDLKNEDMDPIDAQIEGSTYEDLFDKLIDPGSKVLEMFRVVAASPKGTPQEKSIQTGSKDHANRVLQMARSFLRTLHDKNTFLPKVLAKVSREENSFIGASIAVSHFLRPIYLYSRVINRKKSLAEAIIKFRALDISPEQNWEFEAFERQTVEIQKNEGEKEITKQHVGPKDLCQNCKMMFLGDKSGKGGRSFLGACAEYCPVDELLPDESKLKVTDVKGDDSVIGYLLKRNLSRCSLLFKEFENIYERCKSAVNSGNDREVEAVYWEVIHKLNIFGLKPECNPYF